MTYFRTLPLALLATFTLISCGSPKEQTAQSESELLASSTRYVCNSDVLMRNDDLTPSPAPLLQSSTKVTLLGGSKSGTGSLSEHKFTKIKLANGSSGWISTKFLKTGPCVGGSSMNAGSIPGSVLHFTGDRPGILAMLDAIAYSEFRNTPEATSARAYNLLFGHRPFSSFARHPNSVICQGLCSAAAGRYQFMPDTWNDSQNFIEERKVTEIPWIKDRLPDFSPASQDKMAIFRIWYKFAYAQLRSLSPNDNVTLKSATAKLAPEWASLPGDFHRQGGVSWEEFKQFFWKRYNFYNK